MKLEIKLSGKTVKELILEQDREYFLGRSSECDIVLEEELSLSRQHLRIYQTAGSKNWNIECLTEKSDLYFNGEEQSHFEIQNICFLNLKNYVLSFIDEELRSVENVKKEEQKTFAETHPEEEPGFVNQEEGTQIVPVTHLLYCLRISIEGEFSDYINLNLGEKWVIGRSEDCDVSINYDLLTRQHLEIEKKESQFYVKDLGSTNRTHLNGSELSSYKSVLLNVDDEISVNDLKIVFEIRDTNYENKVQNLPAKVLETDEEDSSLPDIVTPKLVLEDFSEEEPEKKRTQQNLRKKISFFLIIFLLSGLGGYLFYEDKKSKKEASSKKEDVKGNDLEHRMIYEEAQNNLRAGNYFECIGNIEELHRKVKIGFYEDSKQIQNECQTGLNIRKQKKAEEEAERKRLEAEAKIKKIEDECEYQYNQGILKTLSDINECARDLYDLDPNNAKISQIRMSIENAELQKRLEEEKKEEYRKWIQAKKNLYHRAKKIDKEKHALKAVSAYDRFLKAARNVARLKNLYKTAEAERNAIQNNYDSTLKSLRESCSSLADNRRFKQAYPSCHKVLQFKNHDKVTLDYIKQIKKELTLELKPIYEEAQWHESFSRIEEATKNWQDILEKDIKGGYYYEKAKAQIKKYE